MKRAAAGGSARRGQATPQRGTLTAACITTVPPAQPNCGRDPAACHRRLDCVQHAGSGAVREPTGPVSRRGRSPPPSCRNRRAHQHLAVADPQPLRRSSSNRRGHHAHAAERHQSDQVIERCRADDVFPARASHRPSNAGRWISMCCSSTAAKSWSRSTTNGLLWNVCEHDRHINTTDEGVLLNRTPSRRGCAGRSKLAAHIHPWRVDRDLSSSSRHSSRQGGGESDHDGFEDIVGPACRASARIRQPCEPRTRSLR